MTVIHSLDTVFFISIVVLVVCIFICLFNSHNWEEYECTHAVRIFCMIVNIALLSISLSALFEWLGWFS